MIALIPSGVVRFSASGLPAARFYLESYLSYCSPFVVYEETSSTGSTQQNLIEGYRNDESQSPDDTLVPKFETQPITLPGPLDEIREQRQNIRKLVSTTKISGHMPDVREKWEKAMQFLGRDSFKPQEDLNLLRVSKPSLDSKSSIDAFAEKEKMQAPCMRYRNRLQLTAMILTGKLSL